MKTHTTEALNLIPYFYYKPGKTFESYARISETKTGFVIQLSKSALAHLAQREFDEKGALQLAVTLLHNYFYIENPHSPDDLKILSIQDAPDDVRPARIHYRIKEN